MPGPLQVIAVSFRPGSDFQGRVLAEVGRLQGRGVLRLLDLLFVAKNEDGTIQPVVLGGDDDFGALLSSIVPLAGVVGPADDGSSRFDPADAWALTESLLPGTALAFLLIEHGWAQPLFDAIAETGGSLLGEGFLTSEAGLIVGAEVAAIEDAAEVIAEAQAAETRATLLALAAETQAAEAIAASEAIQAAAAASAISALITAGIVEEAAAHEAVEALRAAGLIVAAADETAAEAVAEDAAAVSAADEATAEALAGAAANVRAASITVAEARVLRYLPTRLSFALIADKLGISRSAAKERAERTYKKLGVHSRAEAVSRARALGLID
ncbi:MAG: LuxR C-terminal-related transcriptional regulator [Solirubrobacteraceae bacterium]